MLQREHVADEERVVARRHLRDRPRPNPSGRACEQPRVVVAHRNPFPQGDGRDAAREMLREGVLLAAEDRDRPFACLAQDPVERRLERDRDPHEPRLERQ